MLISLPFRTEILISPVSVNVSVDGSHLSTPPEISLSREEVPFLRLTNSQGQPSFDSSLAPLVKAQDISEHLSQVKSSPEMGSLYWNQIAVQLLVLANSLLSLFTV